MYSRACISFKWERERKHTKYCFKKANLKKNYTGDLNEDIEIICLMKKFSKKNAYTTFDSTCE